MSGIKLDFVHKSLFDYVVASANTGERQTRGNLTCKGSKCSWMEGMCDFSNVHKTAY